MPAINEEREADANSREMPGKAVGREKGEELVQEGDLWREGTSARHRKYGLQICQQEL